MKLAKLGLRNRKHSTYAAIHISLSCPGADMSEFFHFENQRNPPMLAANGMLRSGTKSNISGCISAPTGKSVAAKNACMMMTAGPAVVHMVKPTK